MIYPIAHYAIVFWRENEIFPVTIPNGEIQTFLNIEEADAEADKFEAEYDVETRVICIDSVAL